MVENTFNLDQVRYLYKQHGGIPLHNQKYHGRLYVICPDPEWRELIAEVVYEESTGRIFSDGVSHHTQRRSQAVSRTNTQGRPAWSDSP